MKKAFALATIFLVIAGILCGCIFGGQEKVANTPDEFKDLALAYLNENYDGDTFTPRIYSGSNWAYEYESVTFTSEKFHDAIVEVRVYKNEDGTYRLKDNYYHCYMAESAIKYGEALVGEVNAAIKVRFHNTVWSDELAGAKTFAEWKEHGTACADIFVITEGMLSADVQTGIVKKIADDKVCGYVYFLATEAEDLLQDVSLDDILNDQAKYVVGKNVYFINRQFEYQEE